MYIRICLCNHGVYEIVFLYRCWAYWHKRSGLQLALPLSAFLSHVGLTKHCWDTWYEMYKPPLASNDNPARLVIHIASSVVEVECAITERHILRRGRQYLQSGIVEEN